MIYKDKSSKNDAHFEQFFQVCSTDEYVLALCFRNYLKNFLNKIEIQTNLQLTYKYTFFNFPYLIRKEN